MKQKKRRRINIGKIMVMNVELQLNNVFDRLLKKRSVLSFNPSEKEFFIFLFSPQEFGVSQPNFCVVLNSV